MFRNMQILVVARIRLGIDYSIDDARIVYSVCKRKPNSRKNKLFGLGFFGLNVNSLAVLQRRAGVFLFYILCKCSLNVQFYIILGIFRKYLINVQSI